MKSRYYPQEAARFTADTAQHGMTVLHDDGLYRHLRFRHPDRSEYWFDLVTWPGCLTIRGDMGSYTFARIEDMLDFFLSGPDINPQYWAEKIQSSKGDVEQYSPERFRQHVSDAFDEADERPDGLWAAIEREVLPYAYDEHDARRAVHEFEFMSPDHRNKTAFVFADVMDWDLFGYSYRYLWCCFAIRWGAEQYVASRAVAA